AWNAWREQRQDIRPNLREADLVFADLRGADLTRADLSRADLPGADLRGADLAFVNFDRANLFEAKLFGADLTRASLDGVDLRGADLSGADLYGPNLSGANLSGADLTQSVLYEVVFGDTNLTDVRGLETCQHQGSSILDLHTLAKSGPLPLAFLRGCGLNDWEIEVTKLYDPRLTSGQVKDILCRIHHLPTDPSTQFYPCFTRN